MQEITEWNEKPQVFLQHLKSVKIALEAKKHTFLKKKRFDIAHITY